MGEDCDGMNSMYAGREGYIDPMRYNMRGRNTDLVEKGELTDYPELGPLGVGVCKQYVGREPRFYASVAYNGATWNLLKANSDDNKGERTNVQAFYYRDSPDRVTNKPLIGYAVELVLKNMCILMTSPIRKKMLMKPNI